MEIKLNKSHLGKYFRPEEVAELVSKGPEFMEKFNQQQAGKIYKEANFMYNRTQLKQMEKAAEKYPEVLTDENWTADELIDHAFQEAVDLTHYLATLSNKMKKMQDEIATYKSQSNYWREQYRKAKYLYEAAVPADKGGLK